MFLLAILTFLSALVLFHFLCPARLIPRLRSPPRPVPFVGDALPFLHPTAPPPSRILALISHELATPIAQFLRLRAPTVLVRDLGTINRILVGPVKASFDRGGPTDFFAGVFWDVLGSRSMLCLRAADHHFKAHRKLLLPSLSANTLAMHATPIICGKLNLLLALWHLKAEAGKAFDAEADVASLTKEIIVSLVFGVDLGLLDGRATVSTGIGEPTGQEIRRWIEVVFDTLNPIPYTTTIKRVLNPSYHIARWRLYSWMDARLATSVSNAPWSIMRDVVESAPRGMPMPDVRDELFTLLLAGDDTLASQLLSSLAHLASSSFQRDLSISLTDLVEPENTELSYAHAMELSPNPPLHLLSAFLSESLRLSGTIPLTSRHAVHDVVLPIPVDAVSYDTEFKGAEEKELTAVTIPKGTTVILLLAEAAREIERGDEFDPRRWLDPETGAFDVARGGGVLSFSLGTRACFGTRLAQLSLRTFFIRLLSEFEVLPALDSTTTTAEEGSSEDAVKEGISRRPSRTMIRLKVAADQAQTSDSLSTMA